ncbi:hypothetical protein EV360DRAFT_19636, partial [Lentinula raphanica]
EVSVTISWVPSHKGVEGNERADQEAKKAATTRSSMKRALPMQLRTALPRSQTAAIRVFRRQLETKHDEQWERSPRYQKFKDIDPSPATVASRKYWRLSRDLPRK